MDFAFIVEFIMKSTEIAYLERVEHSSLVLSPFQLRPVRCANQSNFLRGGNLQTFQSKCAHQRALRSIFIKV